MDRNFDRSLAEVLKHEGGYVNHPKDPGGATNLGVTLKSFRTFVKPDGTVADLKKLTIAQAGVVYRRNYWDVVMASDLEDGVDFAVFDFAVNSGPSRAVKMLQSIIGVPDDGKVGPKTLMAARAYGRQALINALCDKRLAFLQGLDTWGTFGRGWSNRVAGVRAAALDMAKQAPEAVKTVVTTIQTKEPVVPTNAEKTTLQRVLGGSGILSGASAFFGGLNGLDRGVMFTLIGIGVLFTALLLFRGEWVAARFKSLLRAFDRDASSMPEAEVVEEKP